MNWNDIGYGMGFGWPFGILILVMVVLATAALIKYLRTCTENQLTHRIDRTIADAGSDPVEGGVNVVAGVRTRPAKAGGAI